jgi:aminoglycoside N3'-acetyltransferase
MPETLKTQVYYLIRRAFNQERRAELKRWFAANRKRFAWYYTTVHGRFTAKELVADIASRIRGDFDILMVHSAFERLLPMCSSSPLELVNELAAFCGPKRTLAMPAFILGGRYYDPIEHYRHNSFDVRKTVAETGLITEVFRRRAGVKRSLHPTHSVCALGPLADELTATHHLATTRAGKLTPFDYMAGKRTVVLGLGLEFFRCLTQAHSVEDLLGDEFPIAFERRSVQVEMTDAHGNKVPYLLTLPKYAQAAHAVVLRSLLTRDELIEWRFRGAILWLTFANRVTEVLLEAAPRGITFFGKVKVPRPPAASAPALAVSPGRESGC